MWICNHLEKEATALMKLVPATGEVENPRQNPKLERFRKACNVVHDVFNNGLCNRSRELFPVMKVTMAQIGISHRFVSDFDRAERVLSPIFERIVNEALVEQKGNL